MPKDLRAFFASPFNAEYRWLREAIASACRQHDVELRAVDEITRPGESIIQSIHQEIDACDFAIAVLDGSNPNVFYELGRLHQASKPTILMVSTQGLSDIPFDVRTFAAMTYDKRQQNSSQVTSSVGNAIGKVRKALDPSTRGTVLLAANLSASSQMVLPVDFEQVRIEAERRLGKHGCRTVDIQSYDVPSFHGWNQVLDCPCGDTVVVVIDLNGDISRVRVK